MTNEEKIEIFKNTFRGREDAHGEGDGLCKKEMVSNQVLRAHLQGKKRIGIYPLSPDIANGNGCLFAVVDIDSMDINLASSIAFDLNHIEIPAYIEASKMKGYHIWMFFAEPIDARMARGIMQYAIEDEGADIEIFPKQTTINNGNGSYAYGNCINLPLFGQNVKDGKTVFLNPKANYEPYPDQWKFLQSIQKIRFDQLAEIMEAEEIPFDDEIQATEEKEEKKNWIAQALQGVEEGNRKNTAIKLAGYYRSLNMPSDIILQQLRNWNEKNSPPIEDKELQDVMKSIKKYDSKKIWIPKEENIRPPKPNITKAESFPIPQFPDVWVGIFDTYRKAMQTVTEAPDDYHFGCLQNIIGIAAGKSCQIQYGQQMFLNFYTCLVGPTGKTRKTTAMKKAIQLLPNPEDFEINILQRLATPEGLLYQMKEKDYMENPKVFLTLSEIATLMRKAKSSSGMGLIETLTELYDYHNIYRHPTLTNPIEIFSPWLSVIGGSTQRWLEDTLSSGEILGGFSNRWMYFTGDPKEPIPHPADPRKIPEYQEVSQFIQDIAQNDFSNIKFTVTDEAQALWDKFYINHQQRPWPNENIASLVRRIPEHIKKTSVVFAIALEVTNITAPIMEISINVGKYLITTVHYIFNLFGSTKKELYEAKIRQKLIDFGGECKRRDLAQYLRSSMSGQELNWALQAMEENGELVLWFDDTDKRYAKKMVTLITS